MSQFEFVQVTFAIILGLGVTEILRGLGEQIRARHYLRLYPLHIVASSVILIAIMIGLWGLWFVKGVQWTFPQFLLQAAPTIALALAAHVIRADCSIGADSLREQYFRNSGPAFLLLASVPLLTIVITLTRLDERPDDATNLAVITAARLLLAALGASMAFIKRPAYHWSVLGLIGVFMCWRVAAAVLELT